MTDERPPKDNPDEPDKPEIDLHLNLGGLLGGLGDLGKLVERLSDVLDEADGTSGERDLRDSRGNVRGRMGWSVRPLTSRPTPARPARPTRPPVDRKPPARPAAREPMVEVFEESDGLLVIAELPGVTEAEIALRVEGDRLYLETTGKRQYAVNTALPRTVERIVSQQLNNGILEVRLA